MTFAKFLFKCLPVCLFVFTLAISGCKDKYSDCTDGDYNNCEPDKPETGVITCLLTKDSENQSVLLKVYEGNWEEGIVVYERVLNVARAYITVDVEKHYSATAFYLRGNDTIMAIDGGRIKLSTYRACELVCYEINEPELDLRLD